uniref:Methyltransferase domain-containing protein n=1 Tax=Acrobeloides nanus TaxID=290746 RepID=A0A914C665_9BILA
MSQDRNKDYEEEAAHHNSALGTKEYWDNHYDMELSNFEDTGDEGEIWFGKSAENRMLRFVCEKVTKNSAILDVGTGNGSVLRKLRQKGYMELTGIDYSEGAVELAKKTAEAEQKEHPTKLPTINFHVADLLDIQTSPKLCHRYDIILDKGTWDAISLAGDRSARLQNYRRSIIDLFRKNEEMN